MVGTWGAWATPDAGRHRVGLPRLVLAGLEGGFLHRFSSGVCVDAMPNTRTYRQTGQCGALDSRTCQCTHMQQAHASATDTVVSGSCVVCLPGRPLRSD